MKKLNNLPGKSSLNPLTLNSLNFHKLEFLFVVYEIWQKKARYEYGTTIKISMGDKLIVAHFLLLYNYFMNL